jgi:membrane fusion protein, multidrug efflux system
MKRVSNFRAAAPPAAAASRVICGAIFCLATVVASGCHKEEKAAAPQTPTVVAVNVSAKDTPVTMEYVAITQSSQQVNIQARVSGFLEKRTYTEGSIVKAGDVLFLMDKKPFQAQLAAAKAALARQQAAYDTARRNLERVKPLTEKNALSKKDLDDATGSYLATSAAVQQAKAQVQTEQLNLSYCTITSPVTGITGAAQQQEGAYISPENSLLTTVAVLSPMWVNFSLSENELKRYRDQVQKKEIIPPPNQNYVIDVVLVDGSVFPNSGRITFASPSYDPKTGTFLLRASVKNPEGQLRPNQYVRARLKGGVRHNSILVPQRAVQQGAKGHFVWVVNQQNKTELRPVVVGDLSGEDWFITEGLRPGDRVVIDGGLGLRPDMIVKVQAPAVQPAGKESQASQAQ